MKVNIFMKSSKKAFEATAIFDTETKAVTVKKGSLVSDQISYSAKFRSSNIIAKQRELYVQESKVVKDVHFSSPSTAANFVSGTSSNGWTAWKTKEGKSIKKSYMEEGNE